MEKENKSSCCPHMELINPLKDDKFQKKSFKENLSKCLFKCQTCLADHQKKLWLCLHDKCEFIGCGDFPSNASNHYHNHYQSSKKQDLHCLFIEVYKYQIICLECNEEIYDFSTYQATTHESHENWPNPRSIRTLLVNPDDLIFKEILNKNEMTNPKVHWKSTKGLCGINSLGNTNFINSVLQAWSNIPTIKKIFKKIYKAFVIMGVKKNFATKSDPLKLTFELSRFIHKAWIGKWRVYNPKDFIYFIYTVFPHFKGFGFHDAFEIWQYLLDTIHNEFKFPVNLQSENHIDEWEVIKHGENYKFSSFISDIFSFPAEEILKCGECEHILHKTTLDYFEISINLTEWKEDLKDLHKITQDNNHPELVYLNDILTYYFFQNKTIETPHDFQKLCPKCNNIPKTLLKKNQIINFPNILCIHLNRFSKKEKESIFVDFPLEDLSLNDFCENKDSIYDFLGVIEHFKEQGHERFRTVIRHHGNGVFFLMDDALVSKVEKKFVQEREAYILIYALKTTKQDRNIRHNISSQRKLIKGKKVKLDDKELNLLPNYWFEKLMTLKNPGKIHSAHLLCPHKQIKPDYYDCFPFIDFKNCKDFTEFYGTLLSGENIEDNVDEPFEIQINRCLCQTKINLQKITFESVTLPKAIAEYLHEVFGGNSFANNDLKTCQTCLIYSQNLRQRRILERSLISKYENREDSGYAIIELNWYNTWKQYLHAKNKFSAKHFIKGYPFPHIIDNKRLLLNVEEKIPLHNLKIDKNFTVVNGYIWKILQSLYEGGPQIMRKNKTIYSETLNDLNIKIDKIDEETIQQIKFLGDEKNAIFDPKQVPLNSLE